MVAAFRLMQVEMSRRSQGTKTWAICFFYSKEIARTVVGAGMARGAPLVPQPYCGQ